MKEGLRSEVGGEGVLSVNLAGVVASPFVVVSIAAGVLGRLYFGLDNADRAEESPLCEEASRRSSLEADSF